jgi:hypothetical protein
VVTMFSMAIGIRDLINDNAIIKFSMGNQSLKWLSITWGLHQCMPGIIFAGYDSSPVTRMLSFTAAVPYASCLLPYHVCLLCLHARVGLDCSMGWVPRRMQPVEKRMDMYEHSAACRYLATWDTYPGFLKFWVPFVTTAVFASLFMIEFRIAYAFIFEF